MPGRVYVSGSKYDFMSLLLVNTNRDLHHNTCFGATVLAGPRDKKKKRERKREKRMVSRESHSYDESSAHVVQKRTTNPTFR